MRSPTEHPLLGSVTLWALGSPNTSFATPFRISSQGWQCFETEMIVPSGSFQAIRAQIYLHEVHGTDYHFDYAMFQKDGGPLCPDNERYRGEVVGSVSIQPTMTAGSTQTVQITLRNNGSVPWDANTKLAPWPQGSSSPFFDPATWENSTRIISVGPLAPGEVKTVEFILRAPTALGQYTVALTMLQDGLLWMTSPPEGALSFPITVTPGQLMNTSFEDSINPWILAGPCPHALYTNAPYHGASYLATNRNNNADCSGFYQDLQRTLQPGEKYRFGIWMRSPTEHPLLGSVTLWALGSPNTSFATPFRISSQGWQCFETEMTVPSGSFQAIRAQIYLHEVHGTDYHFDYAMFQKDGGPLCPDNERYRGEVVGSVSVPPTMTAGSTQTVQITLRNNGSVPWDANTKLGPHAGVASPFYDPATWENSTRIISVGPLAPGEVKTVEFILRAPTALGQYTVALTMLQDGLLWMTSPSEGALSFPITVTPGQLMNTSFEDSINPWILAGPCPHALYTNAPYHGTSYLATNRAANADCSGFYQDVFTSPQPGETYRFGIWMRSPTGHPLLGSVTLWALGSPNTSFATPFRISSQSWQCFETEMTVPSGSFQTIRAQIYLHEVHGTDYHFDYAMFQKDGGPLCPDNERYRGEVVGAVNVQPTMTAGSTQTVQITLRNNGSAPWDANTKLGPHAGVASPFYDPATWENSTRIISVGPLAPGEVKTVEFILRAPTALGQYTVALTMLQDGLLWMTSPPEGALSFPIRVSPPLIKIYLPLLRK